MLRFESPWMFLLLALLPLVYWLRSKRDDKPLLYFPVTAAARKSGGSWRQSLSLLPAVLRVTALILLVVALARPQMGVETVRDISRGVAIEMVVDRSSSMGAEMRYKGLRENRLGVVKRVFEDFVDSKGDLPGRPSDLIGMITFARYPDTVCPLTFSHGTLEELISTVKLVDQRPEDGTAIGDAVALAAARLRNAEQELARKLGKADFDPDYEIKSKIVILLTDGENNAGERSVEEAAELAKEWGIRVYAIGVGEDKQISTGFGIFNVPKTPGVDDASLRALAETTGGVYRLAEDSESLIDIYREIDQLEKSEIEAVRYLNYRELYTPFALFALFFAVVEAILRSTVLRTIP
ncbi:MAG: VWA domain-containing protein [Bryobacterales bacterium]